MDKAGPTCMHVSESWQFFFLNCEGRQATFWIFFFLEFWGCLKCTEVKIEKKKDARKTAVGPSDTNSPYIPRGYTSQNLKNKKHGLCIYPLSWWYYPEVQSLLGVLHGETLHKPVQQKIKHLLWRVGCWFTFYLSRWRHRRPWEKEKFHNLVISGENRQFLHQT